MPHRPLQQVALPLVLLLPRVHILVVVVVRVIVAGEMVAEAVDRQVNWVPVGVVDLLRVHQDRPQVEAVLVVEQMVPELVPVVIMMLELEEAQLDAQTVQVALTTVLAEEEAETIMTY